MKKLAVIAALAVSLFGFAGAAQAQHHGGGAFHGGGFHGGVGYGHGGYYPGHGDWYGGRGGVDIILRGGRGGWYPGYPVPFPAPYPYPVPPQTRVFYETFVDSMGYQHTISHVATWNYDYNGYVWYDRFGNLRVN